MQGTISRNFADRRKAAKWQAGAGQIRLDTHPLLAREFTALQSVQAARWRCSVVHDFNVMSSHLAVDDIEQVANTFDSVIEPYLPILAEQETVSFCLVDGVQNGQSLLGVVPEVIGE